MDPIRRTILTTGAAATAMAAAPRVFAQATGQGGTAMSVFEKGGVRIHFAEAGSGFPLLLIAGGGLNSTISGFSGSSSPFNPRSRSSRQSTAALHRTCATPTPVNPPARSRSTGRGMHTPTTTLV